MDRRRRGAKIAYVKEKRAKAKDVPLALQKQVVRSPPKPEHWMHKSFKEREQSYEKHKDTPLRVVDRLANKEGFRHNVYWVTGEVYRGHWKLNQKDGSGIQDYSSGNRYEGGWKNGKRDGYGTFYIQHADTDKYRVVYKGHWKGGDLHGPGYLYCAFGERYEGDFEHGMRSGYGKQSYWCPESRGYHVYVGHWARDKREGMGTLTLVNGDFYQGEFVNDMKDGRGIFNYISKGATYEGLWKKDVAVSGTYRRGDALSFLEAAGFGISET